MIPQRKNQTEELANEVGCWRKVIKDMNARKATGPPGVIAEVLNKSSRVGYMLITITVN